MTELCVFYVYILFRLNGIPCYVGKGKGYRWQHHEQVGERHANKHLARIIVKAGGSLPMIKVREGLSEADALATEVALIAAIGRGKNGPLVNLTDGGDGVSGMKHSEESKQAIRQKMLGRVVTESSRKKIGAAHAGKTVSGETREKLRIARQTFHHSPESKARISASMTGRTREFSEEHCAKLSAAKAGSILSESHKAKIAASQRGRRHPLAVRQLIGDAQRGVSCPQRGRKGRVFSEEHKASIRAALAKRRASK